MMKHILFAAMLALLCGASIAKGSSSTSDGGQAPSGFVPIEDAQRVFGFNSDRLWGTVDGEVLVCPFYADASDRKKDCTTKDGKNGWIPLLSLSVPGHELSGVQYFFAGQYGYRQLLVFFRKRR